MIKQNNLLDCPVMVKFRWSPEKNCYVRCKRMFMHHCHHLEIKDRHFIYNEQVVQDIKLYVACGVQPSMIQQLVNKKYSVNTKYCDIYHMIKMIRQQKHKGEVSNNSKCDVQQLIDTLHYLRDQDSEFRFAYVLDEEADDSNQAKKIDRMFF